MEKSLAYRDSTDIGIKIKIKTETNRFAYVMRAMCQSLSYGNTDQIGRRAWNGFMEYIEKSVATFVNECNAKYKNGKDPKINPRATPDFLPDGIPEFISTTTHNNTYDISIGQITSSLTMEQVMSVYEKAKETEVRKKGNRGPGAASAASTSALTPGPSGDPAAAAADIPEYTQEQKDYRHMREMLKTLSSAMDKPIWDNCTNIDDPCVMPNIKRVPDISVVVDGNDKTLTYPILIGEVLGKKDKGPKYNQLYEGYNATMQCLVFGPRAYYFEIDTTEAALTILKKNPGTGTVTGKKKVYQLAHNDKLLELINDLSAALLDGMINVRPIAYVTATKLKERNYMDFLSPPPGKGKKLQIHCWHVFVPDYNHSLNEVPEEYNPEVDKENVTAPKYGPNQIPDFEDENLDNSVIEVEHFNIKDNADLFDDVSFCRGYRDDFGTPLNMKGRKFSDVWKKKAQEGQEKMIMNDVNKILNTVSEHFRDYLVNKKMRQEIPEINPSGADIKDVWEMKADTKGVYLSLVENDDVVISHLFPPDDEEEDEYAHVDLPQPPEPEHEEHIATLKFPSYTSQKMREYYTQKIKKIRGSNPTEYQMPHSEWTPGRRSTFARQLTKMMEGDDFRDPLSTKLAFTETGESSHMEPLEEEREPGEAERQQREKHAQPQHQAPPQQQQLAQQQAQGPQAPQHQAPPPPPQQQAIPQLQQLAQQAQAPQHQAPPPPPQQQAAPQLQQLAQQAQGPQAPQHQAPPPPPQQQAAPQATGTAGARTTSTTTPGSTTTTTTAATGTTAGASTTTPGSTTTTTTTGCTTTAATGTAGARTTSTTTPGSTTTTTTTGCTTTAATGTAGARTTSTTTPGSTTTTTTAATGTTAGASTTTPGSTTTTTTTGCTTTAATGTAGARTTSTTTPGSTTTTTTTGCTTTAATGTAGARTTSTTTPGSTTTTTTAATGTTAGASTTSTTTPGSTTTTTTTGSQNQR